MITLGIETSGQQGSVALLCNGQLLGNRDLSREGRRHARTLLAEIRDLLSEATVRSDDVNTLAVSIGPGSFTGLRVGVTVAKTWAYATKANAVAVDTFLAIARQASTDAAQLQVINDAQRGDLFVGRFDRSNDGTWKRQAAIEIVAVDDWLSRLSNETAVTGPAVEKLESQLAGRCFLESPLTRHPLAASISLLGEASVIAGQVDDLWRLEPLYLRRSAAEEKADLRERC